MAIKIVKTLTSDKSGAKIADGKAVSVRIRFEPSEEGGRARVFKADLTEREAKALVKELNAREPKTRGKRGEDVDVEDAGDGEGGENDEPTTPDGEQDGENAGAEDAPAELAA